MRVGENTPLVGAIGCDCSYRSTGERGTGFGRHTDASLPAARRTHMHAEARVAL